MREFEADLVVVGAGPAGSSAARQGALRGLKVLLVERKRMPRVKPCGGVLSKRAMDSLGFDLPAGILERECRGARFHYRGRTLTGCLKECIAVLVSRETFDSFLLDKAIEAGAELMTAEAIGAEEAAGGITLRLRGGEVRARCLIVAEGAAGRLTTMVRKPDGPDRSGLCLEHRFEVPTPDPFSDQEDLLDFYFDVSRLGYGWLFHHGRFYSVGVGGMRSTFKDPLGLFHSFCRRLGLDSTGVKPSGHLIPCGGFARRTIQGRVALVGDSAGFVDGFYGEGIYFAIRSGQLAADVMADCVRREDFSAMMLAAYPRLCENEFGRHLRGSMRLTRLMHMFPDVFFRIISTNPETLDMYLKVVLGRLSYPRYMRWLILRTPLFYVKSLMRRA